MKTTRRENAVVLSLATEDFADPPQVEAALEEVVRLLRTRNVVVDMKSVTALTSIGVSAITAGADVARENNARFALAGLRPEVHRFLERIGVVARTGAGASSLEVADDVETALRSMAADEARGGVPPERAP